MNPYADEEAPEKEPKQKLQRPCQQLRIDLLECLKETSCVKEVKALMYREFMDYQKTGCNIFELSHRSEPFLKILVSAKNNLKAVLAIPDNYEVLFLQGGATGQFSGIPLNLMGKDASGADYFVTGHWSAKAAKEAGKYGPVNLITPLENVGLAALFPPDHEPLPTTGTYIKDALRAYLTDKVNPEASYFHYCSNETIDGFEVNDVGTDHDNFPYLLEAAYRKKWASVAAPGDFVMPLLVCDMSSNFCTKPIDVSRFSLIYAGAQKNIGIAGVTVVVIRRDLIGKFESPMCPSILSYKVVAAANSLPNTPPVYSIYALNLTLKWMLEQCVGLKNFQFPNNPYATMALWDVISRCKADHIYEIIDSSHGFYAPLSPAFCTPVQFRSRMNIPFRVCDTITGQPSELLEKAFVEEAKAHGLLYLKGHRSVGGLRVSLFNSISMGEVLRLFTFMQDFQRGHAKPKANKN